MQSPLIVEQQMSSDCAVATMAMYLGLPYAQVLAACRKHVQPFVGHVGLTPEQIIKLAKFFGVNFKMKKHGVPRGKAFLVIKCPASHHAVYYDGVNALDPQYHSFTTREYLEQTVFFFTERWFL